MKKKLILIFVFLLILNKELNCFIIPMWDWKAVEQRILMWLEGQFDSKKQKLDEYSKIFEDLKNATRVAWGGFEEKSNWGSGGWKAQKDIILDLKGLKEAMLKICDLEMDSWGDIFENNGGNEIINKYPNLTNYDFVKNTPIYKRSPVIQKQIKTEIDKNNEIIKRYENNKNYLKVVMSDEKEIGDRIEEFQKKITSSGQAQLGVGDIHGILFLNAIIRYETMRARMHVMAMTRLLLEQEIVERVSGLDDNLRKAREDAAAAEANMNKLYETIK